MENKPTAISKSPRIVVVSATSQGAREYQEDAWGHWADNARVFAVVADGAGGHGGGADASRAAIASAAKTWELPTTRDLADPAKFLATWMTVAHQAVIDESARIKRSARTVVVACLTDGHSAHWVHAGDCRLLRFHDGKLVERTRDDSVVQVLFERGDITEQEMGTHPDQSRLLQSLGGEDPPSPRPGHAPVEAGDVLILCSDGFWEHLTTAELEKLAACPPTRRQPALEQAVAKAVSRGGSKADNTTALMIAFDGDRKPSRPSIFWILLLLAALAAGAVAGWLSSRPGDIEWLRQKIWLNIVDRASCPAPSDSGSGQDDRATVDRASCPAPSNPGCGQDDRATWTGHPARLQMNSPSISPS